MRAIIQKVNNASVVTMDEMMITAIGAGLVVWVGMRRMDRKADIDFIVKQILNFQIYDKDEKTKWSQTVVDKDYEILCLSEVTLYCNTKGPFKPTFYNAMDSDSAKIFFTSFINELKQSYKPNKVRRGRYWMSSFVNAQFVGPVFSIQSPREAMPTIGPLQRSPLKQSGPGSSQFGEHGQPTRTIPRGVGKFYGQKDYNWQYQQNQHGYNQETYNQPVHEHYQQPYEQYPYGQQANKDYRQHNVYNPQANVQGSYGGQVYGQHPQSQQYPYRQQTPNEQFNQQTHNQAYNQQYHQQTTNQQYNQPIQNQPYNQPIQNQQYNQQTHNQQYNQQTPYQQYNQQTPYQQYNQQTPNQQYNQPIQNQQYNQQHSQHYNQHSLNQQYQQLRSNQPNYQPLNQHYFQQVQNANLTNQLPIARPTSL